MKSYIKLVSLGVAMAGLSACTDLDTVIDAQYPTLPDNPIIVDAEFNSCYFYLHGWFGRDFQEGFVNQGDEVLAGCYTIGDWYDDGRAVNGSIHSLTVNNWNCHMLADCMSGANMCNEKIALYGGPEMKDPIVAPLRLMRAWYHFWAMEGWGDVPLLDHKPAEGERVDRQPRADVVKFIADELEEILAQTNEDGTPALSKANDMSTYGKPNYWMGAFLLAKVYLNWGVYTHDITTVTNDTPNEKLADCMKWCDEIIQSGVFEVGQGYRKKFFPDNGVHIKDFIYALNVDPATQSNGCIAWYRYHGFKYNGLCSPTPLYFMPSKSIGGTHVVTPEAVKRFNLPGDERNQIILSGPQFVIDNKYNITDEPVMFYKDVTKPNTCAGQLVFEPEFDFDDATVYSFGPSDLPAFSKQTIADGTAQLNCRKGARCFKFPPRQEDYDLWNRSQANDYPIMRFADVLMMKAECILRGVPATNGQTVADLINPIRLCASAPTVSGAFTLQDLLDERSRELFIEPWRRNDLIRFGQFENDWAAKNQYKVWDDEAHTTFHMVERPGAKDPRRRLMPIYKDELTNNTNWSQNPGYEGVAI